LAGVEGLDWSVVVAETLVVVVFNLFEEVEFGLVDWDWIL
jgi:hypothetical protein